jgi:hypothetical protein
MIPCAYEVLRHRRCTDIAWLGEAWSGIRPRSNWVDAAMFDRSPAIGAKRMATRAEGYQHSGAAHLRFAAIAQILEMLKASHPKQSRTPEATAAIAELELLTAKFDVTPRQIPAGFIGN